MGARGGLGLTLLQLGRVREAIPHLEFALSCNLEGKARVLVEGALIRARRVAPGVLR
jgi:hypothetical protein